MSSAVATTTRPTNHNGSVNSSNSTSTTASPASLLPPLTCAAALRASLIANKRFNSLSEAIGTFIETTSLAGREDEQPVLSGCRYVDAFSTTSSQCVSLPQYCRRLEEMMELDDEALIIGLVLLHKALKGTTTHLPFSTTTSSSVAQYHHRHSDGAPCSGRVSRIPLTNFNVRRLLLTSMITAVKLRQDSYYPMTWYAAVGGVALKDLVQLELVYFSFLDYDALVTPDEFQGCCRLLNRTLGGPNTTTGVLSPSPCRPATVIGTDGFAHALEAAYSSIARRVLEPESSFEVTTPSLRTVMPGVPSVQSDDEDYSASAHVAHRRQQAHHSSQHHNARHHSHHRASAVSDLSSSSLPAAAASASIFAASSSIATMTTTGTTAVAGGASLLKSATSGDACDESGRCSDAAASMSLWGSITDAAAQAPSANSSFNATTVPCRH